MGLPAKALGRMCLNSPWCNAEDEGTDTDENHDRDEENRDYDQNEARDEDGYGYVAADQGKQMKMALKKQVYKELITKMRLKMNIKL